MPQVSLIVDTATYNHVGQLLTRAKIRPKV